VGWLWLLASHSRYFWGLRLHLIATPAGLPVAFALADPKIDEREVAGIELIRPARRNERPRRGARQPKPLRQIIESINATLKTQLSLERHGGHSPKGVLVRVLQRLLALTAAIWHNHLTGQPVARSPHRLRPLTPWIFSSRAPGGARVDVGAG
jgi:hypothetical protein